MPGQQAVIVGAGGHAVSLAETVTAAGYELVAFTSEEPAEGSLLGRPVLAAVAPEHVASGGIVLVAIGDNFNRQQAIASLLSWVPADQLPAVVHPSASVSAFATLGPGTVVTQGAVVGSGARVGTGCLVNSGAIIEHECAIGDYASLAPRAAIGGRVSVGARSALGIGAVTKHGLSIGADTVIGAASYVHVDVPAGVVAFGVPARVVRERRPDDPYLR